MIQTGSHIIQWQRPRAKSTGTSVHTSANVVVAMAVPASACRALQRRAAQSVDTTFRISQQWQLRTTIPVCRRWSSSPPKLSPFSTGPLPTFSENFMQIRSVVLAPSCYNKQTNNNKNITSLAEVIRRPIPGKHGEMIKDIAKSFCLSQENAQIGTKMERETQDGDLASPSPPAKRPLNRCIHRVTVT